jgi:histidyl-tRNA synthetase
VRNGSRVSIGVFTVPATFKKYLLTFFVQESIINLPIEEKYMRVENLWAMVSYLNDYTVTAIDTAQELGLEVYILKGLTDFDTLMNADTIGITDLESGNATEVSLAEFIDNTKDEVLKTDYDALDAINFFQIGVFGEIVYG